VLVAAEVLAPPGGIGSVDVGTRAGGVVVARAAVVVVANIVAVVAVVAGATGRNMVGTSKEASWVLGAWDVDTRNSPPTISMMAAAGLVRRSVQRRFIRDSFRLAASEPLRSRRTVCPGRPG